MIKGPIFSNFPANFLQNTFYPSEFRQTISSWRQGLDVASTVPQNSVGGLQELCMARGLGFPRYNDFGDASGQFRMECVLGTLIMVGIGPNKVRHYD